MIDNLYKKIKESRKQKEFTQEYVAGELGMSRPTYVQIEQGTRELTVVEAKKLASIFAISLEDLLGGTVIPQHEVVIDREMHRPSKNLKIRVTRKNLNKFKQVLLYILSEIGGKPNVGETVIHKLLYFIDFDYYEKFEESLMGATYIKNHHGPTSIELKSVVDDMQKKGEAEIVKSQYFKYEQKKYLAIKKPDLSMLSAQEIEHIDNVLARLSDKNAKEIEKYSHDDVPWKVAEEGEPLLYESVFYRDERYSVRNYDDEL